MTKKLLLTIVFTAVILLSLNAQWQPIGPGGGILKCFDIGGTNVFSGTFGGGLFLTTNNGVSWTTSNNGLTNLDVQSIDIMANGTTMFVGTYGGGVFLSTNAGANWVAVNTGLSTGPANQVGAIAIKGTTVFAGTNAGVFKSTNNGTSWSPVNTGLGTTLDVLSLVVSGTDILVGIGSGGVFLSTNDGGTWVQKNTGLSDLYINSLAVSGSKLFAGNNSAVYSSTNNGGSWSLAVATPGLVKSIDVNGSTIYAGYGTMASGGITKSTDNGINWTTVSTGLPSDKGINAVLQSGSNVFAGSDGKGLYITSNGGSSWASDPGIVNTNAQSLSLATSGTNVFTGIFGSGIYLSSSNGSGPWVEVNSGLPSNSIQALVTNGTTAVFAGTYANGVYKSSNNGTSWTALNSGLSNLNVTSFAVTGTYIYAGTFGGGVFRANIGGSTWTAVNTGLTNLNILSLVVSGSKVYAGTFYGGVFYSSNNGSSWTAVNNGLTNLSVNGLAMSGSRIYAGTLGGVFSSNNNGSLWTVGNTGLTDLDAMTLFTSGTRVFLGTDGGGVFLSNDSAITWSAVNTNLGNYNIYKFAESGTSIFAGTKGSGVWKRLMSDFDFSITTQSANVTACAGVDSYFSVAATGVNITYQWQISTDGGNSFNNCFDGSDYSGVYTNTLTIIGTPSYFNGFQYHCVVTCGNTINSTLATLTLSETPSLSITNPPSTCSPNTVDITNAFIDLNSTAGTVSYWTNSAATTALTSPTNISSGGTYYIKKTLTSGVCYDIQPVIVDIGVIPNLSITNPQAVCLPNTIDITNTFIDLNSTSGTISYWTDSNATVPLSTPTGITAGGTYYIKKTSSGACLDIAPVLVVISTTPDLLATNPPGICAPNSVDITTTFTDLNSATGTVTYWTDAGATIPLTAPANVTEGGTFFIKKTVNSGCSDIVSVKVIIWPLPNISYTQNPLVVCFNEPPITLSAASPSGGTYSGAGVTNNSFNPFTAGLGTWPIVYTYTNNNSCTDSSTQNINVALCTSVDPSNSNDNKDVFISPNPFNASLSISGFTKTADIILYNMLGAKVGSWNISISSNKVDTRFLPSGIYLLEIKTSGGILKKKIIKE